MFGNIFKGITNAVTAPFRSAGNILSGKGNIGDLLSVGSVFMPGGQLTTDLGSMSVRNAGLSSLLGSTGLGALRDPSRMTGGDLMQLLGSLSGAGGRQGGGSTLNLAGSDPQALARLLMQMQMANALSNEPLRQQALRRGYDALTPSGRNANAMSVAQIARGQGTEAGRMNARALASRGYASGVSDAALLQGTNQGTRQGNEAIRQARSPQAEAQAALAQAGLMGDASGLNMLIALQNAQNNQRMADAQARASAPPTFLETILGIGGTVLPYVLDNPTQAPRPTVPRKTPQKQTVGTGGAQPQNPAPFFVMPPTITYKR